MSIKSSPETLTNTPKAASEDIELAKTALRGRNLLRDFSKLPFIVALGDEVETLTFTNPSAISAPTDASTII